VPRFHNLSFPTFDGKVDPLGWLNKCEQFFCVQHTLDTDRVWLASYHLSDTVQQWYITLERDAGEPDWDKFKLLYHQRSVRRSARTILRIWRAYRSTPLSRHTWRRSRHGSRTRDVSLRSSKPSSSLGGCRRLSASTSSFTSPRISRGPCG
jgi:hypothetical protein